jgi:tRNA dimethylallyltransferase
VAKPLVAIVGETGSGKSDLAMRIAKKYDGEIICADATTVKKGMDIGTAKPSQKDRQEVPHHLLDLVEPDEPFSVAEFQKQASVVISDMHKRNRLPILVGGSGLYIDSILYNYSFLTTDSSTSRDQLNSLEINELIELIAKEHINTAGIDLSNKRRLIRLIETKGARGNRQSLIDGALVLGLIVNKDVLRDRIAARLELMLKEGLEEEVRNLSQRFGWEGETLKPVAYREWQDYFNGSINESELKERIIKDNLALAKKQRTWFKRNPDIEWLTTPVYWRDIVELMTTIINTQV